MIPILQKAHRVEIPASITAVNFYRHMGYTFKMGMRRWMINSFIDWKVSTAAVALFCMS